MTTKYDKTQSNIHNIFQFAVFQCNALVTFGQPRGNFPAEQKTVQKLFFSKPQ